jgi:hypothetical protein
VRPGKRRDDFFGCWENPVVPDERDRIIVAGILAWSRRVLNDKALLPGRPQAAGTGSTDRPPRPVGPGNAADGLPGGKQRPSQKTRTGRNRTNPPKLRDRSWPTKSAAAAPQQGHLGKLLMSARISRTRMVANRVWDVALRPPGRILWVYNCRVSEVSGTAWRNEVLRGESSPVRRSGIRKPRCTAWHDDGSRASHVPRNARGQPPA